MTTRLEQVLIDRERLAPRTREAYLAAVRRFLAFAGEDERQWTPQQVKAWRDELGRTIAPQSVNNYLAGLKSATKTLAKVWRDPMLDFAEPIEAFKTVLEPEAARAVTPAEAHACITACRGPRPIDLRDTAMMALGFRTGMRRMSLRAVDIDHLDPSTGRLKIWIKGQHWHTMPPLDEITRAALDPWLAWLKQKDAKGPVFRRLTTMFRSGQQIYRPGPRLSLVSVHSILVTRAKLGGVKDFSPHAMRHSFVTWMRSAGAPPDVIAAWTGHKSLGALMGYSDGAAVAEARKIKLPDDVG